MTFCETCGITHTNCSCLEEQEGMTLEEAIQILTNSIGFPYSGPWDYKYKAVKLGIEAMKDRQRARKDGIYNFSQYLPGETR